MLIMETKNKKIRNPFPAIGKVFKYEMISVGRMILPVYAVLLALSLIIGVFVMNNNLDFDSNGDFGVVKAIILMFAIILFSVMIVILFSVIARRFKKSILGDEAYLNLTLPVSIGEHLCGRYLANFVWGLSYAIVMVASVLLILIRGWNRAIPRLLEKTAEFKLEYEVGFGYFFCNLLIHALIFFMLICVFIYVTGTIIHLIGKHKTLTAVLSFATVFTLYHNIAQMLFQGLFYDSENGFLAFTKIFIRMDIYDIVWICTLSIITRLILTYRLNLE